MDETRQRLLNEFHKWYHDSFIGELDIVSMAGSKKVRRCTCKLISSSTAIYVYSLLQQFSPNVGTVTVDTVIVDT